MGMGMGMGMQGHQQRPMMPMMSAPSGMPPGMMGERPLYTPPPPYSKP